MDPIQLLTLAASGGWYTSATSLADDETLLVEIRDGNGNGHKLLSVPIDKQHRTLDTSPKKPDFPEVYSVRAGGTLSNEVLRLQNGHTALLFNKSIQILGPDYKRLHNLKHPRDIVFFQETTEGKLLTCMDDGAIDIYIWDTMTGERVYKQKLPKLFTGPKSSDKWYWRTHMKGAACGANNTFALGEIYYQSMREGNRTPDFSYTLRASDANWKERFRLTLPEQTDQVFFDHRGDIWVYSRDMQYRRLASDGEEVSKQHFPVDGKGWHWGDVIYRGGIVFKYIFRYGAGGYTHISPLDALEEGTRFDGRLAAVSPSGKTWVISSVEADDVQLSIYRAQTP